MRTFNRRNARASGQWRSTGAPLRLGDSGVRSTCHGVRAQLDLCDGLQTSARLHRSTRDTLPTRAGRAIRPVRPGRHSYSGVPVTEVAAAREDVTHVVYVCAFAMPAGTSMLDALGAQPRGWWIFAEDGESIMPDYPGPLLYGECAPAVANGAIARLSSWPESSREPPSQNRPRPDPPVRPNRASRSGCTWPSSLWGGLARCR
jgi:hypothetical protein